MAWRALLVAGLLETAWAAGLKAVAGDFRSSLLIAFAALMIGSLAVLLWSMRTLALGIAYPVWTGIGSVGSVAIGVRVFKQDIGAVGIAGIACLRVGMFLPGLETH